MHCTVLDRNSTNSTVRTVYTVQYSTTVHTVLYICFRNESSQICFFVQAIIQALNAVNFGSPQIAHQLPKIRRKFNYMNLLTKR